MKDKRAFGAFIKEKRIEKNYSQKDLAELLFVTESAVSKWERGVSYPDITLITDICRVLEITEHELIESSHDVEYRKMKKEAIKYNKLKNIVFWTLNICYAIAILTCFIVNLAVNHTLSWFFIVLTAILCAYSFCPTFTWLVTKYKKLFFIGSTFISLFFLFLTCSIYTNNFWFMIPTSGLLLGYFVIFHPILYVDQKRYLEESKYKKLFKSFFLTYSVGILVLTILLLITIFLYNSYNLLLGIIISCGCMLIPIILGGFFMFNNGTAIIKVILIVLASVIFIGVVFGFGRGIYLKSTQINKEYKIIETFDKVNIELDTLVVNIYLSDTSENKAICVETKNVLADIKVIDGVLVIRKIDNRKFYDQLFSFTSYKIDLYLSRQTIDELKIKCSTGDVFVDKGFTFGTASIINSTGDIEFKSNVTNNLELEVSTGDIEAKDCNIGGNLVVEASTGDIELTNVNCDKLDMLISTGDIDLSNVLINKDIKIEGGTGSVYLDGIDAANIDITVSTGNVKGTILSTKFFIAHSGTGKCIVPETRDGGMCRITCSTGDIYISYK